MRDCRRPFTAAVLATCALLGAGRAPAAPVSATIAAASPALVAPAFTPAAPDAYVDANRPNGTLRTRVPALVDDDPRREAAFAALNAARLGAGAGLLAPSPALETSASRHAAYLVEQGFESAPSVHAETPALAGYTGPDPFTRMKAAGYGFSYATEVIGDIGSASPQADCVGDLLDTVYHATLMLSRVTEVGFGFGSGDAAGLCTIDLATPLRQRDAQVPPSGAVVAYPYAGLALASGTFAIASENPRAAVAMLPGELAGRPVLVGFRNQDYVSANGPAPSSATTATRHAPVVTIERFALSDARGANVPAVILADPSVTGTGVTTDIGIAGGFAVLVPMRPLAAGRYTVTLRAAIAGGQPLALSSWSFTIGGVEPRGGAVRTAASRQARNP